MRHPIVIAYENRIETVPRELKALKAVWEPRKWLSVLLQAKSPYRGELIPRLISDNNDGVIAETMIAFIGTFQPSGTFPKKSEPGNPS
jgi:hypothetical protein